jgi:polyferredoxin
VVAVLLRIPLELDVIRDRNTLFREGSGGRIENVYTLKIMNMDSRAHSYRLTATGIEDMALHTDRPDVQVASGEVVEVPVTLSVDPSWLKERSTRVQFLIQASDNDKLRRVEEARFLGPGR